MHRPSLRNCLQVPGYLLAALYAASASAQPGATEPPGPPPPAPAVSPSMAPAAPPPPAAVPSPGGPSAAPFPGAQPTVPPSEIPPQAPGDIPLSPPPPQPPPLPPQYGRLGGEPEPPIERGSWNPWAHPLPGRFSHDGFFLRLNLGVGYAGISRPDYKWSAAGLGMGLSIGGSLVENLALHADFHSTLLPNPTQKVLGRKSDFDGDIVMESMGLGLTYYIMPANVFLSGSVGIARLVFEDNGGQSKETNAGLALGGMIGKEWWVGSDWGLGIAAQVLFSRVGDYVDDKHLNALALNVMFSATYN